MSQRFAVVGLNFRTAPLALRGAFAFDGESQRDALQFLKEGGVEQALILSTCNRIEVYAFSESDSAILDLFHRRQHGLGSAFYQSVYRKHGEEAIHHLFRVAAGLDSKILGENEIQGQLRRAWAISKEERLAKAPLQALVENAIRCGKRVRSETEVGRQVLSMGSLAVRTALGSAVDFGDRSVAVVGTGEIARRVLRELKGISTGKRSIFSRTYSRAEMLGGEYRAEPFHLDELAEALPEIDVLFSATHSQSEIVHVGHLLNRTRPLTLVDLAVPATIAKETGQLPNVTLSNVDDLSLSLSENQRFRERAAAGAEALVEKDLNRYLHQQRESQVVPLVSALHRKGHAIGQEQLDWALGKLGDLGEEERQVVQALANRLVSRLLHHPLTEIKGLAEDPAGLDVARRLLGLGEELQDAERVA